MFTNRAVSEIIANSFFIVLGYFFGHNLSSRSPASSSAKADNQ